jgi:membrane protein YqaA with SNARE-associated domain
MLLKLLSLAGICFLGGAVWVFNAETTVIVYGAEFGFHPFLVGLVAATAQCAMYALLFYSGGWLMTHWRWLGSKIEKARNRFADHLQERYLVATASAALIGLPPMTAMAALGKGFQVRILRLLIVAFIFRVVRFTLLAALGFQLRAFWQGLWA